MVSLFLLLWSGAAAGAEEIYELDQITVKVKKTETELNISPEGNTEDIPVAEKEKPVVSTIPDVLDKTEGVDVQRRSILTPKNSQVRLRGFDESRYNVMLDGRLLNGTGVMGGFYVDWTSIPLLEWEQVEVGKGAYSAKYGNTLGGTINLVPKRPDEELDASASAGLKRYGTFGTADYAAIRYGHFGGVVTVGYDTTDGNLRNSEAERQNYSGTLYYYPGGDGELRAAFRYVNGEFNLPVNNWKGTPWYDPAYPESSGSMLIGPGVRFPYGDTFGDGSYYTKERFETEIAYRQTLFDFDTETIVYYNYEDRKDVFTSMNLDETVLTRDASPDLSWGWSSRFKRTLGSHLVGFGGEGHYLGYDGTTNTFIRDFYFFSPISDGNDEHDASRWHGVYLDDTWKLFDKLDLYGGLRLDNYFADQNVDAVSSYQYGYPAGYEKVHAKFDETTVLPKFGAVYRPVEPLSLYGRIGRATRFPNNPELYWYYGGYRPEVDPNSNVRRSDLTYEDALQFEGGASYRFSDNFTSWLTYYDYQVDDYIRWIWGYMPGSLVYNIDEVRLQGVELAAEGRIWKNFFGFANFTYQHTQKEGDVLDGSNDLSDELSELPEYKANWGIKYQRADGALASVAFRYVGPTGVLVVNGENYASGVPLSSAVELEHLGGFVTMDLLFRYPVIQYAVGKKQVVGLLSVGVENLFDKKYVEEYYFPAPGRSFNVALEAKF
ncbi:TonB-dependent receptor [Desulforhabdus amnigena]|uniref:TonB-dependent receptor n=1 Tax=Desulforhabdus amnigena TaxID=40218 RepID=UPI0016A6D51C|nr:TonB-dependent receptor [Desulforhabdus amnigena]NLJ28140.1 TonB-dependent receptor [Deltaproteobacteria bacterium]